MMLTRKLLGATAPGVQIELNGTPIASGTYIYNNSNTLNSLGVYGGTLTVTIHLWGAAGGNGSYSSAGASGAGGYAKGTITLQPNITYYFYVGEGGKGPSQANEGDGGLGGWPNGGYGTRGDATGAGGGGMTMFSKNTFSTGMSDSDIILIAGGGGGSTGYNGQAGAGGGTTGQNGAGPNNPTISGGSQAAGGTYNGSKLQGGNATGDRTTNLDDGGGGGGGYYGGGGGTSDANPGAGGSGYYNSTLVSNEVLTQGTGVTAPDPSSLLLSGYANGKTDSTNSPSNGANGLAYITF